MSIRIGVTIPDKAGEMLEQLLANGLYGISLSDVARTLILERLQEIIARRHAAEKGKVTT